MDTTPTASGRWSVELVEHPLTGQGGARRVILTLVGGLFGGLGGNGPSVGDLVFRDVSTARIVHRSPAGHVNEAPDMLHTAQEELLTLSPARFADEWGFPAGT